MNNTINFGITRKSFEYLMNTFKEHPGIEEVIIFGSRAMGNYRKGSDIDLAIKGDGCSEDLGLSLQSYVNEDLPVPYMIDIVDYNSLSHKKLKEHIDYYGKVFYRAE